MSNIRQPRRCTNSQKQKLKPKLYSKNSQATGYREYDLYACCKQWNKKNHPLSIGARISQNIAKRAFQAVEAWRTGQRGKPRFKGFRGLHSIEDNSLDSNLRLKDHTVHYLGLALPLLYNPKDPIHYHGMSSKIKYIRMVQRNFNGRLRYFAQLISEGTPWIKGKNAAREGVVGLDIGPQTIAIVAPEHQHVQLKVFADELKPLKKKKQQLQRKLSRQLRSANPSAFEQDTWQKKDKHPRRKHGKNIRGKRLLCRPQALKRTSHQLADISRREAAYRKTQHGQLANELLRLGKTIKTEKLSYKAFQKLYGSSIGLRAPGRFMEILQRKAVNAGGQVTFINPWTTALSQTCHCGKKEKKPLSQRWHKCACGATAQRDLYAAYLASFVENNVLMVDQAQKAWSGMDIALRTAMGQIKQTSSGLLPASLGLSGSESVVCTVS